MKLTDSMPVQFSGLNGLLKKLHSSYHFLQRCRAVRKQRIRLSLLSSEQLEDIGLSAELVKEECQKGFFEISNTE